MAKIWKWRNSSKFIFYRNHKRWYTSSNRSSISIIKILLENYRENVAEKYKIQEQYIQQILSKPEPENINIYEIMQEIGRKRGTIISGGQVDDEKPSRIILEDFRSGKLGKITIEKVERK